MKNKLIVYTNSKMAQEVRKEREKWNLLDKTIIIEINNETEIEPQIFQRLKEISEDSYFLNYRMKPNAVEEHYIDCEEMVAWIDFGFNHGTACYNKPEEFNFLWTTSLPDDKIHLFTLGEISQKPIFHLVRALEDSIMGCLILLPASLCQEFWQAC